MNLLLAEDEKALNTALTEILKRSGYNVTSVFNGEDALLYLKEYTYDAVILDIMMPKIDGLTALKTLRADKNSVPVILLTAKSEVEDKIIGLDSGADGALDSETGIIVQGGTLFACSSLGMVETPATNSTAYVLSYAQNSAVTAGTTITVKDSSGNEIYSVTVKKNCQSIIFSLPEFENGGMYSLYDGETELTTFTVSSIITSVGSNGGMGGQGGPGGQDGQPGRPGGNR